MSTEERLERYLAGEMSNDEQVAFERQILADDGLAEALYADQNVDAALRDAVAAPAATLVAGTEENAARTSPAASSKVVSVGSHWAFKAALPMAAALAILVLSPRWFGGDGPVTPGNERFRGTAESIVAQPIAPVGVVESLPDEFLWQPVEGSARYRFELFDAGMQSLVTVLTDTPRATVDAATLESAARQGQIMWMVVPVDTVGRELSPIRATFTVDPAR